MTGDDVQRAVQLLDGPFARPADQYSAHDRAAIDRVAQALADERAATRRDLLSLADKFDVYAREDGEMAKDKRSPERRRWYHIGCVDSYRHASVLIRMTLRAEGGEAK